MDFSEARDLAAENPKKLAELKAKFDKAAQTYHVLPLDDRGSARIVVPKPTVPGSGVGVMSYIYFAGRSHGHR